MVPDPTADENLTLPSGRGVAMIRSFMDDVIINEIGNKVTMTRHSEDVRAARSKRSP
jgi:hypothetical protein